MVRNGREAGRWDELGVMERKKERRKETRRDGTNRFLSVLRR